MSILGSWVVYSLSAVDAAITSLARRIDALFATTIVHFTCEFSEPLAPRVAPFIPYTPNPVIIQNGADYFLNLIHSNPTVLQYRPDYMASEEDAQVFFAQQIIERLSLSPNLALQTFPDFIDQSGVSIIDTCQSLRSDLNQLAPDDQLAIRERFTSYISEQPKDLFSKYMGLMRSMRAAASELTQDEWDSAVRYLNTSAPYHSTNVPGISTLTFRLCQTFESLLREDFPIFALRAPLMPNSGRRDSVTWLFHWIHTALLELIPEQTTHINCFISANTVCNILRCAIATNFLYEEEFLQRLNNHVVHFVTRIPGFIASANEARARYLEEIGQEPILAPALQPVVDSLTPQNFLLELLKERRNGTPDTNETIRIFLEHSEQGSRELFAKVLVGALVEGNAIPVHLVAHLPTCLRDEISAGRTYVDALEEIRVLAENMNVAEWQWVMEARSHNYSPNPASTLVPENYMCSVKNICDALVSNTDFIRLASDTKAAYLSILESS